MCSVRQEAAKAVEERTKVTASMQEHATDAGAKVNKQDTLADGQVQAAVATGLLTQNQRSTEQSAKRNSGGGAKAWVRLGPRAWAEGLG